MHEIDPPMVTQQQLDKAVEACARIIVSLARRLAAEGDAASDGQNITIAIPHSELMEAEAGVYFHHLPEPLPGSEPYLLINIQTAPAPQANGE